MRILITGSREWSDWDVIEAAIIKAARDAGATPRSTVIVHGNARGADRIAAGIARTYGCAVEEHPANWDQYGKAAGHRRNVKMVNLGADICLAFPLGASPGTWGCVRLAKAAGIPVTVHEVAPPKQGDLMSELVRISQPPDVT